jgi:hypothetical protein
VATVPHGVFINTPFNASEYYALDKKHLSIYYKTAGEKRAI